MPTTPALPDDELTPRRRQILRAVIREYVSTGQPVGSKTLVEVGGFSVAPSTLRYELAWLERHGLLDHPHTSAGRVPTDRGYRYLAEELIAERGPVTVLPVDLSSAHREIDSALRATTEALSQVTNLLAVASAPALSSTVIRHVEVLLLQPQIVMVVVITATGAVAKRTVVFETSVDPGLAEFAREYLNETVTGVALGTVALRRHLEAPDLSTREREFLAALAPVFSEVIADGERLYVGGAGRLMSELRSHDSHELTRLADVLEERAALLQLLSEVLGNASVSVRIGREHPDPVLRPLAVIAASYGLARRQLGTVSLVGPTRMDYPAAVAAVRGAAVALSAFVEDVYEG
jgi:heat-inducible transcriptional repressor